MSEQNKQSKPEKKYISVRFINGVELLGEFIGDRLIGGKDVWKVKSPLEVTFMQDQAGRAKPTFKPSSLFLSDGGCILISSENIMHVTMDIDEGAIEQYENVFNPSEIITPPEKQLIV